MDIDYAALGKRVAKYRKIADMTQEQLAESSGISTGMVGTLETGNTKASIETLVKLANTLHTTVDAFLYDQLEEKEAVLVGRIKNVIGRCSKEQLEILADSLETQKLIIDAAEQ